MRNTFDFMEVNDNTKRKTGGSLLFILILFYRERVSWVLLRDELYIEIEEVFRDQ